MLSNKRLKREMVVLSLNFSSDPNSKMKRRLGALMSEILLQKCIVDNLLDCLFL